MKPFIPKQIRELRIRGRALLGVVVLVVAASGAATAAQADTGRTDTARTAVAAPDWQSAIRQTAPPSKGCFTAAPQRTWRQVACVTPPDIPFAPALRRSGPVPGPMTVGKGTGWTAKVTGLMTSATGSFPSVSGVTGESGALFNVPPATADAYSLQLNTNPFVTVQCLGHPTCLGWEQFVFLNEGAAGGIVFIQYWLLKYDAACPAGWNAYTAPGSMDVNCWMNAPTSATVADQPITNLANLTLTGSATGSMDTATLTVGGGGPAVAVGADSVLNLSTAWDAAEFIVAGPGNGSEADFNPGAKVTLKTTVQNGTKNAPTCELGGYSLETNNLTLDGTPALSIGPAPAMQTTDSYTPLAPPGCSAAAGDTHLFTFSGLAYDFQATGDFLLAQVPNFSVQNRQISGAPSWPNAAVNQAVAAKAGDDQVAVCTAPTRLAVDGVVTPLADGKTITLSSGVSIHRTGDMYTVVDSSGNTLRALVNSTANPNYVNAYVDLGLESAPVRGLLANPNDNVNQLQGGDGAVYTEPVSFNTLYQRYGESWRLAPADSALSVCGSQGTNGGDPSAPFYASNLDPTTRAAAQAVCARAGVKISSLLDMCTLDVAVLGKSATATYVGAAPPVLVGNPTQ